MTFLATWGCASDFLKMLTQFKIAAKVNSKKICGRKNLKSEIIQILLSDSPPYGDDFFKVLLKFKMAATDQIQFFGGRKNSKN